MRGRGAFRAWAAALIAVVAGMAVPAAASAAVPDGFFGVAADRLLNDNRPADWDAQLEAIAAAGIGVVRADAFWANAEPNPPLLGMVHQYNWTGLDQRAEALASAHLRWLPVLDYSTPWAASSRTQDNHAPPARASDFASYAGAFAKRYGPGGSFWSDHPDLPQIPVTSYEIWNEPNNGEFWRPQPDPARYDELYSAARSAIQQVDPSAQVLTGGLANSDPNGFIRALYNAGIGSVDGLGLHPYARDVPGVLATIAGVRATLAAVGAANTPIYVTEVGWPTHSSAEGAGALPDATRAGDLALLSDVLARSDCGVSQLVVYTWSSPERDQSNAGDWFGIAARDGGPTVSSRAYSDAIRRDSNGNLGPTLPVCSGPPIRGAQALDFGNAAQVAQSGLTLGLSLRKLPGPRHRACYRARVTYQGLPINRAAVRFGHLRPLSRRNRRAMTGRTGSDGAATLCGRRGRARVVAVASLAGIAASPPATAGRR